MLSLKNFDAIMKRQRMTLQCNRPRQGTIYVLVLLSSLIVGAIGLSSLQLIRLQSRTATDNSDFIAARCHARAGIEIGMLKIRNNPFWRRDLGNGTWLSNQPIGSGSFSLTAVDPIDGDVTKGDNHPVTLTGIGMQGDAVFKTSARLEIGPRVGSCMEVSMSSGGDMAISGATLTSDQSISSNGYVAASSGATVNADVEAYGSISGSTYTKTRAQRTAILRMPDPSQALNYYLTNGTTISYTSLPAFVQSQCLTNRSFESNVSGWYAKTNCALQQSLLNASSGLYSMLVSGRSLSTDVAAQDVPLALMKNGGRYRLSLPILPTANGTARAQLTIESTGDGVQTFTTPAYTLSSFLGLYSWENLNGDVTPTWTGTITKATVSVWMSNNSSYYMDNVSMIDVTYASGTRVLEKQLLSPSVNPYGSVNAEGIYIINCSSQNVVVSRSRIVGTLVFVNPGVGTTIQDSVAFEAAVYNYPVVLANNDINIALSSAALNEATVGINLNPPGTPYPYIGGSSNTTATDSFVSKITGLVYSADDLAISGASNLTGVVLANDDIDVNATSTTLSYGNVYLNEPPPGFDSGAISMKVSPGTWQRTVN